MSLTDRNLFCRIAQKNEVAFTRIYRKYHPVLFSRIRRFVRDETAAEDLTQGVFIKLWLYGEPLKDVLHPAAWLNRVASNASLNHIRQKYIQRNMKKAIGYTIVSHVNGDQDLSYRQLVSAVLEGLSQLPLPDRSILRLHLDTGYGPTRLAAELELPEGSVKKKLEVSRKFLREYVQERIGVWLPWVLVAGVCIQVG